MIKQKGHLPSAPLVPNTVGTRMADQLIQPVQEAREVEDHLTISIFPMRKLGSERTNHQPTMIK